MTPSSDISFAVSAAKAAVVMNFVSNEETRYYLNGILIEPNPNGGVTLVATDGHRLVAAHDPQGHADQSYIVALSKDCLGQIRKLAKTVSRTAKDKNTDDLKLVAKVTGNASGQIVATLYNAKLQAAAAITTASVIDGSFPDWRRVVPQRREEASAATGWNPKYLADFSAVSAAITIFGGGRSEPALIDFGRPDFLGVIMPFPTSAPACLSRPDWCEFPAQNQNQTAA